MNIYNKNIMGFICIFLSKVIFVLLTLVWNSILARNVEMSVYGQFAFFYSVYVMLSIPASGGIPNYFIKEGAKELKSRGHVNRVYSFSLLFILFVGLIISLLVFLFDTVFLIGDGGGAKYWNSLVILLIGIGVIRFSSAALRLGDENCKAVTFEQVLMPLLFILLLVWINNSVNRYLTVQEITMYFAVSTSIAAVVAITLSVKHLFLQKYLVINWNPTRMDSTWILAQVGMVIPFALVSGVRSLTNTIDVLVINSLGVSEEVAIYKVAFNISLINTLVMSVLATLGTPIVARYFASNEIKKIQIFVSRSTMIAFLFSSALLVFMLFFGKDIISIVFGHKYVESALILRVLIAGQMFSSAFGIVAVVLNMSGNVKKTTVILVEASVINLFLSLASYSFLGIEGVAFATSLSIVWWNYRMSNVVYKQTGIRCSIFYATKRILPKIKAI